VALVLKGSVSDLAETIEEDSAGEGIPGLSFIKAGGDALRSEIETSRKKMHNDE
jgi:hypothetical protein